MMGHRIFVDESADRGGERKREKPWGEKVEDKFDLEKDKEGRIWDDQYCGVGRFHDQTLGTGRMFGIKLKGVTEDYETAIYRYDV